MDSGQDGLGDGLLGVRLDDVHRGPRNRKALEVRNSVRLQAPFQNAMSLVRNEVLKLGQDERMAPIENDRRPMGRGSHHSGG